MKYIKRTAIGLLAGALCATGVAAGAAAVPVTEARAEVGVVQSTDENNPTLLNLNKEYNKNLSTEKDGSYYYFETDSSLYPYTFDVNFYASTDDRTANTLLIECFEIKADGSLSDRKIAELVRLKDTWITTFSIFKPNKKYALRVRPTFYGGYTTDEYLNVKINIKHEGVFFHKGRWTYFNAAGDPDYAHTGVVQTTNGNWVFVSKGIFDTSFTGVAQSTTGNWVFVRKGRLDNSYTGVAQSTTGNWVYVIKGRFSKEAREATGVTLSTTGNSVYITDGRFTSKYTGLARSLRTGDLVYVTKGKYDPKFNGKVIYEGRTYTVRKGRAV